MEPDATERQEKQETPAKPKRRWIIKCSTKFFIVLVAMTIICTIVWGFVGDRLYNCTDACGATLDFICPGNWVHCFDGHAIVSVHQIVRDSDMSHPDTIKKGWSGGGLWCPWLSFVAVSLIVSILLARVSWTSGSETADGRKR